jgi:hypothetical protein
LDEMNKRPIFWNDFLGVLCGRFLFIEPPVLPGRTELGEAAGELARCRSAFQELVGAQELIGSKLNGLIGGARDVDLGEG